MAMSVEDAIVNEDKMDQNSVSAIQEFSDIAEFLPLDLKRSLLLIKSLDKECNLFRANAHALSRYIQNSSDKKLKPDALGQISLFLNQIEMRHCEAIAESKHILEIIDNHASLLQYRIDTYDHWPIMTNEEEEQARLHALHLKEKQQEKQRIMAARVAMKSFQKREKSRVKNTEEILPPGFPRLTEPELVVLRKRMKKSPHWDPSEKIIRRELVMLGRLQPDGTMWPEDVAAAEAAGLKPTVLPPRNTFTSLPRVRHHNVPVPSMPRQAREKRTTDSMAVQYPEKKVSQVKRPKRKEDYEKNGEPTYCICNDVSYGEMVACDNKSCPKEWFHFACVGITASPNGAWYCPICLD